MTPVSQSSATVTARSEPVPQKIREKIGARPADSAEIEVLGSVVVGETARSLVAFRDGNGAFCVAFDFPGREGTAACDIDSPKVHPVNMAMEVMDDKTVFLYGGARGEVRDVYLVDESGSHRQRLYAHPSQANRWFFIAVDRYPIKHIYAKLSDGRPCYVEPEVVKAANAVVAGRAPPTPSR